MRQKTLDEDILCLLLKNKARPHEIRESLKKEHKNEYDSDRVWDVTISRAFTRLTEQKLVRKYTRGSQNVSYALTRKGDEQFRKDTLTAMISEPSSTEVQVLQYLMLWAVDYAVIMAPMGARLEDYIKILRDWLSREDVVGKARALHNDPRALYAEFNNYVAKYHLHRAASTLKERT